jgi:hypothetical protein
MVTRKHLTAVHPAFSDAKLFPDEAVAFWAGIAEIGLPADRFKGDLAKAHALYVAHQVAIHAHVHTVKSDIKTAHMMPGGKAEVVNIHNPAPGTPKTRHRRKYVVYRSNGKLPKEFDTPDTEMKRAAVWNSTSFGQKLHLLRRY